MEWKELYTTNTASNKIGEKLLKENTGSDKGKFPQILEQ
jgi:hypothetical protein